MVLEEIFLMEKTFRMAILKAVSAFQNNFRNGTF